MATYHIDINHGSANNSNAGTSEGAPWLNFQALTTRTFNPLDLILPKAGTYAESAEVEIGTGRGVGTAGNPITLRAYPGHEGGVIITRPGTLSNTSNQSVLRVYNDYWKIQTLTFRRRILTGYATGQEVSYCLFDGIDYPSSIIDAQKIRPALQCDTQYSFWCHHNEFKNYLSSATERSNHGAVIVWTESDAQGTERGQDYLFEDNYIHDCALGFYEKDSGLNNVYQRNYVITTQQGAFRGNNQHSTAIYDVRHNIMHGGINVHNASTDGARFFNNWTNGTRFSTGTTNPATLVNLEFYNNVMINLHSSGRSWESNGLAYNANLFAYYDNQVYSAAAPLYRFAGVDQPLSYMTARGHELDIATGVALGDVYTSGWALKAPYTTAGRANGPVGPVDGSGNSIVALILDTSRYGPSAFDPGAPSNQPPTASLSITNITNLTVDTDNTGSVDPDGTIASRSTNWGDGSAPSTGTAPSHTYAAAGVYNITLTVTDDEGATDQDTEQVQLAGATLHLSLASVRPSTRRRGVRI